MKSGRVRGITHPRGSFKEEYIRKLNNLYLQEQESSSLAIEDELLLGYLEYHVTRLHLLFLLSGAHEHGSLRELLEQVIKTIFRIAVFRDAEHCSEVDKISVNSKLNYKRPSIPLCNASLLGRVGRFNLGQDMILGSYSSDCIPQLDLQIELGYNHLRMIRENPGVLHLLMMIISRMVPIHLDYIIGLRVRHVDCLFRLGKQEGSSQEGTLKELSLGMTSVLGAG